MDPSKRVLGNINSAKVRHARAVEKEERRKKEKEENRMATPELDRYRQKVGSIALFASELEDLILALESRMSWIGRDEKLLKLKEKLRAKLEEIKPASILAKPS